MAPLNIKHIQTDAEICICSLVFSYCRAAMAPERFGPPMQNKNQGTPGVPKAPPHKGTPWTREEHKGTFVSGPHGGNLKKNA